MLGERCVEETSSVTPGEGGESALSSPICPIANRQASWIARDTSLVHPGPDLTGPVSTSSSPLFSRTLARAIPNIDLSQPSSPPRRGTDMLFSPAQPLVCGAQGKDVLTMTDPVTRSMQRVDDVHPDGQETMEEARQRHSRTPASIFHGDKFGEAVVADPLDEEMLAFEDGDTELLMAVDERTVLDDDNRMTAEDYQAYVIMNLSNPRPPMRMETVVEEPDSISGAEMSLTGETIKSCANLDKKVPPVNTSSPPPTNPIARPGSGSSDTSSGSMDDTEADRDQFREMLNRRVTKLQMSLSHSSTSHQPAVTAQPVSRRLRRRSRFAKRLILCGGDPQDETARESPRRAADTMDTNGSVSPTQKRGNGMKRIPVRVFGARRSKSVHGEDQSLSHSGGGLSTHASMVSAHSVHSGTCSETNCDNSGERCVLYQRPLGFESVWLEDEDCVWPITKDWPLGDEVNEDGASKAGRGRKDRGAQGGTQTLARHGWPSLDNRGHVWSLALSANRRYLAAGTRRGTIHVWALSITEGEKLLRRRNLFVGHTGGVMALQWSPVPDTDVLISLAFDKTVRLWSMGYDTTLSIVRCVQLPIGLSFATPVSDDRIVMCTLNGASQTLSLNPSPSTFSKLNTHQTTNIPMVSFEVNSSIVIPDAVTSMSVSPDGTKVAYGTQFGRILVLNMDDSRPILTTDCRNRRGKHSRGQKVTGIDWGGDDYEFLVVTTRDDRIRVVPIADPSRSLKFKGASIRLKAFMDPSNRYVICAGHDGKVYIWSVWEAARIRRPFRRREQFLARLGVKSAPQDSVLVGAPEGSPKSEGLQLGSIQPLPADVTKRPTALPLASFDVPNGNSVTSLLVTIAPDATCVRIICGTATGSVYIYMSLLSD